MNRYVLVPYQSLTVWEPWCEKVSLIFSYIFYHFVFASDVQSNETGMKETDFGLESFPGTDSDIMQTNDLDNSKPLKLNIIKTVAFTSEET